MMNLTYTAYTISLRLLAKINKIKFQNFDFEESNISFKYNNIIFFLNNKIITLCSLINPFSDEKFYIRNRMKSFHIPPERVSNFQTTLKF